MPVCAISLSLPCQPFTTLLLLLCTVLLGLSVPAYFRAIRPRRGTTEWIQRLDPPTAAPLQVQKPCSADVLWALLIGVCVIVLRLVYSCSYLLLHLQQGASELVLSNVQYLLLHGIPYAILAIAVYFLLRTIFGAKLLPAFLCATMAGFLQNSAVDATALLLLSLLFLYVWMCAPYDAPLFFNAFWLLGAGLSYAFALLRCWEAAWLAPFYLCAYLITQLLRWHFGDRAHRGKKLTGSLLLTLLALFLGTLLLWLLYCILSQHIAGTPVDLLRSSRFYRELLPTFGKKLSRLFRGGNPLHSVLFSDAFGFLAGVFALVPLVHSVWKQHDTRSLFLLCLLPFCLCAWLLGGAYLLPIPLLLAVGRVWQVYTERDHPAYVIGFFCVVCLCYTADILIF